MKYKSELIKDIVDTRGHEKSSLHYESECIETWVAEASGAYPKLMDYQSEWLKYIVSNPIGEFPYITLSNVTNATVENVVPYAYKSAILKGSTKYRDIDTGEFLETFEEGRNLELVSVKMPVLTTSNEDGTKTIILTVNEDVTLRGIGDVKDTLDLTTGELTQRIGEVVLDGSEDWKAEFFTVGTNQFLRFHLADVSNCKRNAKGLCDKEKVMQFDKANEDYVRPSSNLIWIYRKDLTMTVEDLKQQLQANPYTIQYELATESVKTVDLSIVNQDGNALIKIKPIEGTMYLKTNGEILKPTFTGEVPVEAITQNLASFIKLEMEE